MFLINNSLPTKRSLAIRSRHSAKVNASAENLGGKMPPPSAVRQRGPVIRQLSLQGQPSNQPHAGRRGLKKQLSEDDNRGKGLDSVEITGQGWSMYGDKPEAGLRALSNEGVKPGHAKAVTASRPRPIKVAWADRRADSTENPTGVEVVARKCQGQPRPLTVKAQRITNLPLLGEKDTLVYTKQQLAERLRIAWREREKNKPNLNIFLAHAAETDRSCNEESNSGRSIGLPQTEILIQDSVTFRSITGSESSLLSGAKRIHGTESIRNQSRDTDHTVKFSETAPTGKVKGDSDRKSILKNAPGHLKRSDSRERREYPSLEITENNVKSSVADSPDFKTFPIGEGSKSFGNNLTNLNYQMKTLDVVSKSSERSDNDKENMESNSPRTDSGFSEHSKTEIIDEEALQKKLDNQEEVEVRIPGTAQERRASFRNGSLMNKAIDESYSSSNEEIEDESPRESNNEIRVILKKNEEKRSSLTRTFSAPSRNETNSSKQGSNQGNGKSTVGFKSQPHYTSSFDLTGIDDDLNVLRGRIKSAPIRRKLKTVAARRKNRGKDPDSSDDEKQTAESSKKKTTRRKATSRMGGTDIVTMVSLVSPATSDAEENIIPIPEESWTPEEKEEKSLEETNPKSTVGSSKEISSFIIQKFVSLRKTNKTVSFVQHPPINRSYSASFPSRRAPAGTPIIIPTPVVTYPALTPAQLQEREKRPQPSSPGVSAGADNRGVKRRLIRTASAPQVKNNETNGSTGETESKPEPICAENPRKEFDKIEESIEEESTGRRAPEFKTPKEKECWMLYQKMTEKGVSVSFDTVLRGMLTPTEYRLRRNQLLSTY